MGRIFKANELYAPGLRQIMAVNKYWQECMIDDVRGGRIINATGTLRHEDHKRIIDKIVEVRKNELNAVMDLMNAGLVITEKISTQLVGYETLNEYPAATRSMNPKDTDISQSDYEEAFTLLPMTVSEWMIPWRQSGVEYKRSNGLTASVRQVAESLEDLVMNGDSTLKVTSDSTQSTILGYTTATNRLTATLSDWTDVATNGAKIYPETVGMVGQLIEDAKVTALNSIIFYLAFDMYAVLINTGGTEQNAPSYLQQILNIPQIKDVKPNTKLTTKTGVMVEMADRTVELAVAQDIITVPHTRTKPTQDQNFTTYALMSPLLKDDRNDVIGICHGEQA